MSISDGAVYPVCPGVSGGTFDPDRHRFHNLTVGESIADLIDIHDFILDRNSRARFIITVSPVPLAATASGEHVLSATTLSKSILRAAAGEFAANRANVAYFPSYEIITGGFTRGAYFSGDLRSVTESGVAHVMQLFLKHYGEDVGASRQTSDEPNASAEAAKIADLVAVICEEEVLQRFA